MQLPKEGTKVRHLIGVAFTAGDLSFTDAAAIYGRSRNSVTVTRILKKYFVKLGPAGSMAKWSLKKEIREELEARSIACILASS